MQTHSGITSITEKKRKSRNRSFTKTLRLFKMAVIINATKREAKTEMLTWTL